MTEPAPRVHRTPIQLRFSDIDALGHVNNVAYAAYAETGRYDFLKSLGEEARSIIVAHLSLDYRRPVHEGRAIVVDSWVERIGRTSVTLRQVILADGERACEVGSVLVFYDYERGTPREVPDSMRRALGPYEHPPVDA